MTRQRDDDKSTEFGVWVRKQPELDSRRYGIDAENLDYIWHDYVNGHIMLLEEKRYGGQPTYAQKDTHGIVDQALEFACEHDLFTRVNPKRPRVIQYHGYHVIRFENTSPDDGWVEIDGERVTSEQLKRFLRFEWTTPKNARKQALDTLRSIALP